MLKKKVLREEDPETGKLVETTTRYDGEWRELLQGDTTILIKFGDEEILNTTIKIPAGKILHVRLTIASVLADA